jgi:ribosomal-protein-alanine N-acetyltransferase
VLQEKLAKGTVKLRPLLVKDEFAWNRLRSANEAWLTPWEATTPGGQRPRAKDFASFVKVVDASAKIPENISWVIEFEGNLVGHITIANVTFGSMWSAAIGYWIAQSAAGQGIMPTAVALATDYCFHFLGLHRVEINIRPDNARSLRVVEKLGFRAEGLRVKYLHINGEWSDHLSFALIKDDVEPGGLLTRWRQTFAH